MKNTKERGCYSRRGKDKTVSNIYYENIFYKKDVFISRLFQNRKPLDRKKIDVIKYRLWFQK